MVRSNTAGSDKEKGKKISGSDKRDRPDKPDKRKGKQNKWDTPPTEPEVVVGPNRTPDIPTHPFMTAAEVCSELLRVYAEAPEEFLQELAEFMVKSLTATFQVINDVTCFV